MLRRSWLVPVLLLLPLASARATVVDETRNVSGYRGVHIGSGIVARVETGPDLVVLRGDEADLRNIKTEIRDGTLMIQWDQDAPERRPDRPITALVRLSRAESLGASGGSRVEAQVPAGERLGLHASGGSQLRLVNKVSTRSLAVHVSGGSQMVVAGVEAGQSELHLSGAAKLSIAGRTGAVELAASGGSELRGEAFAATSLDVQGSGGCVAKLRVDGPVQGSLSGGTRVHVPGATSVQVDSSGGSRVVREL